jgi:hypothetical protein
MEEKNSLRTLPAFIVMIVIFFLIGYGYSKFFGSPDCVRSLIDQSVRCECDFDNHDAWQKYKDDTKDGWEPVVLKTDPCK